MFMNYPPPSPSLYVLQFFELQKSESLLFTVEHSQLYREDSTVVLMQSAAEIGGIHTLLYTAGVPEISCRGTCLGLAEVRLCATCILSTQAPEVR